jgi:hypothetical protein
MGLSKPMQIRADNTDKAILYPRNPFPIRVTLPEAIRSAKVIARSPLDVYAKADFFAHR